MMWERPRWTRRWRNRTTSSTARRRHVVHGGTEVLEDRLLLSRGDLLLADAEADRILRFDGETGANLGAFVESGSGNLRNPLDPEFGPDGDLYVISNDPQAPAILRFNGADGAFVDTFVAAGVGGFDGASAIAFGTDGDLYVATNTDTGVLRFDGNGSLVGVIGAGDTARASGLNFGPDGNLYVMDSDGLLNTFADRVLRYEPDSGSLIDEFVAPGTMDDVALFSFGPDGHLYVPEVASQQLLRFNGTTGEPEGVLASLAPGEPVFDVIFGRDGNAYLSNADGVQRFDSEIGVFLDQFVADGSAGTVTFFPPSGGPADLAVADLQTPPGAVQDRELTLSYTVINNSANATTADEWVDVIYVSRDDIFDPQDTEIARIARTGGLAGGASYTETVVAELSQLLPGEFHLLVVADRRGQVAETLRANNLAIAPDPVEVFPSLCERHDPTGTLAVGRNLSSYTTFGLTGHEVTIEYTVHNLTSCVVHDVLLATTLTEDVALQGSSRQPQQSGRDLAWNLGSLDPFASVSTSITVARGSSNPLQLDEGPQAFGLVDATAALDDLAPTVLRTDPIDATLLASTPDANTTDPFILSKAAELNHDPTEIIAYTTGEIAFESYVGSLRGSRGTLWGDAGNALDQSSLTIALLRASGIPAQYVAGTLSEPSAQQLIESMFPEASRSIGLIPDDATRSDPVNDPQLISETRAHYWVQFDSGSGFRDADPTFSDSEIGDTFTVADRTFSEVPGDMRHTVSVRLNVEITTAASGLFGVPGQQVTTVLTETFNSVDLVGRPLSFGHFVHTNAISALIVTSFTHTYAPYIAVGDVAFDSSEDEIIRGQDFQEVFTNFPFGSQIITGQFLEIDLAGPDGPTETFTSTIVDRLGFAARSGNAATGISIDPSGRPTISNLDIFTLNALPGLHHPAAPTRLLAEIDRLQSTFGDATRMTDMSSFSSGLARQLMTALTRLQGINFLQLSDNTTAQAATVAGVKAYFSRPRLILTQARTGTTDAEGGMTFRIDLRNDRIRVIPLPGQNVEAAAGFRVTRGIMESAAEAAVLQAFAGEGSSAISTAVVFGAASDQGIGLTFLDSTNLNILDGLFISLEAKARITAAINAGQTVLVPNSMVEVDGLETIAWYQIDPETGETIGVGEDGGHLGLLGWGVVTFISSVVISFILRGILESYNPDAIPAVKNFAQLGSFAAAIAFFFGGETVFLQIPLGIAGAFLAAFFVPMIFIFDPPVPPTISDPILPPLDEASVFAAALTRPANRTSGDVSGTLTTPATRVKGRLQKRWQSTATNGLAATTIDVANGEIRDSQGALIGTGAVALQSTSALPIAISGTVDYSVTGTGSVTFYPPDGSLAASAFWKNYSASLTGDDTTLTLTTDRLTLDGVLLPSDRYTITTTRASLTGHGTGTTPTYSGAATVEGIAASLQLQGASGDLQIDAAGIDTANGLSLAGFTGTMTITPDGADNTIQLSGTSNHVLRVETDQHTVTTDQNTPATFRVLTENSRAGTYDLVAEAPNGWTVDVDDQGLVTVSVKAGVQSGTFPVRVTLRSRTDPNLVAQAEVQVTVSSTAPGVELTIEEDDQFFLPVDGAQVRTAYRALIRNLGPEPATFDINSTPPDGFEVTTTVPTVTVSPGETGIVGFYLEPTGTLPAPGTNAPFTLTTVSQSDSAVTDSLEVDFTVPAIHGVTLVIDEQRPGTLPGEPVDVELVIAATGNVPETVTFNAVVPDGLMLSGLQDVTLQPGQSVTQTLTLTPHAATPLNSELTADITASFGTPQDVSVQLRVDVVAPGVTSVLDAASTARDLGNAALAGRLEELSLALTNKVQNPASEVFRSQAIASLESVISLLAQEEALAGFVVPLGEARDQLAAATTPQECQDAVTALGEVLDDFGATVTAVARHNVQVFLTPNTLTAQPQTPAPLTVTLINRGSETTTYTLELDDVPANVTAQLNQTQVTLDPGESVAIDGSLTTNSTTELVDFDFVVTASAFGVSPEITRSVPGSVQARSEVVSIVEVTATPPFGDAGSQIAVAARLLNAVNRHQEALVTYTVTDPAGTPVFTLPNPVSVTLSLQTSLTTVELGTLDTSGFGDGPHTITVSVTETDGTPLPGGAAAGSLLIGSPLMVQQDLSPDVVPPGTSVVTSTVDFAAVIPGDNPLTLVGQQAVPEATGVAVRGDVAYVCGSNGINVVDYSDPRAPALVGTVGSGKHVGCLIQDDLLLSIRGFGAPFELHVFSITADPLAPVPLGNSESINYGGVASGLMASGTHAFVTRFTWCHFLGSGDIFEHLGEMFSIALNLDDPDNPTSASPALESVLFDTFGDASPAPGDVAGCPRSGGARNVFGIALPEVDTAYLAASTVTGTNTHDGTGIVQIVDITDQAAPVLLQDFEIPGTVNAVGVAVEGTTAVVIGTTGGWNDPVPPGLLSGNLTLTTLDITDTRDPQILSHRTLERGARTFWNNIASLGNGLFSFASMDFDADGGNGEILLVDASNPRRPFVVRSPAELDAAQPNSLAGDDGLLLTSDAAGLVIYEIGELPGVPVTARVEVPNGTGVEVITDSFNVPPTQIIPGADVDTLIWDLTLTPGFETRSLSFDATVTQMQPGESRGVTTGTTIEFSFAGAPGELSLPPQSVVAEQILALAPASRTVRPGEEAGYTVTITNPAAVDVTYDLATSGVPASWVQLVSTITVPAGTSVDVPLTLASDPFAVESDYGVVLSASTGGVIGSVAGTLTLVGAPLLPTPQPEARGLVVSVNPQAQTVGQGTRTSYRARITNTGGQTDTYDISLTGLPADIEAVLSVTRVEVPPGASNFREVTFTLTAADGTTPDDYPFGVQADSASHSLSASADALLTVVGLGVDVDLQPAPGFQSASSREPQQYRLLVTNTGQSRETYDLDLAAPVALAARLHENDVTLDPGESAMVEIDIEPLDFAFPGTLSLVGMATARSDDSVMDADQEELTISVDRDLGVSFERDLVELSSPGAASLMLLIDNLGNLEDEYRVQITSTTGPLQAALEDLSGQSAQSIPMLLLPGLSQGAVAVNAVLNAVGTGTVTLLVESLNEPGLTRTVTGTVSSDQAVLRIEGASLNEGDNGQRNLQFTVSRETNVGAPSVSWSTADGTARAGQDYVASAGTVSFTPGGSLTQTIMVPVAGDELVELNETLSVSLSDPLGATIATGTATGTIVNDDQASVRINNFAAVEGDDGTTVFRFNVRINRAVDAPLTLSASTQDASASAGSDYDHIQYQLLTLQATPRAGAVVPLEVTVHGDALQERQERFFVNLAAVDFAGRNVVFSDSRGRGTIRNDDAPPTCGSRPFGVRIEDRQLVVVGTNDDDEIDVRESATEVDVELNDEDAQFAVGLIDRILICALGGDDDVERQGNSILPAQIEGGPGDDEIDGGRGPDRILGGPGDDDIEGGGSADELFGGSGQDELDGDTGHDFLNGGSSRDQLNGGPGDDILIGAGGADLLIGDEGTDILDGGRGADILDGEADRDILIGGDGADELDGDSGEDILIPGRLLFRTESRELMSILREWTSDRSQLDRIANLRGQGSGPRLNGEAFLTVENGGPGTVLDDTSADTLHGNEDTDWLFAAPIDELLDHELFEELDVL